MALARSPPDVLGPPGACAPRHDPGDQHTQALKRLRDRHGIYDVSSRHLAPRHVLEVNDGGRPRDRDGFRDRADAELDINVRREPRRQFNPLAHDRVEATKREGHSIRARTQLDDLVSARAVGEDSADLFDQRGTPGFDGDTG